VQTIRTTQHRALVRLLIRARRSKGLRQIDLARRLHQQQSWIARIESGQRRIDVVEFIRLARAMDLTPSDLLKKIERRR